MSANHLAALETVPKILSFNLFYLERFIDDLKQTKNGSLEIWVLVVITTFTNLDMTECDFLLLLSNCLE